MVQQKRRVSIDLCSIRHVCTMREGGSGGGFVLAMRTRRPPRVENVDVSHDREIVKTALDPSGIQAFACPTSHLCLKFACDTDFRETSATIKEFIWTRKVKKDTYTLSETPSRHNFMRISHEFPPAPRHIDLLQPLTADIIRCAGDSAIRILYALEGLMKHGNLRVADVPHLLQKLLDLFRMGELESFSKELEALIDRLFAVHHCNCGDEALSQV